FHPPLVAPQGGSQRIEAVWCVSDCEPLAGRRLQAALAQVRTRLVATGQLAAEERLGVGQDVIQRLAVRVGLAPCRVAGDLHAGTPGKLLDRVEELQPVVVHQEADGGTVRPAAEAVVELLGRRDSEAGRALIVERAPRRILPALLLELYPAADQLDDVGAREQVVDEGVGNAGHGVRKRRSGPTSMPRPGLQAGPAISPGPCFRPAPAGLRRSWPAAPCAARRDLPARR